MMRFIDIFGACADSVYQALLFPPPRKARASPYAGKIGTGDEAREGIEIQTAIAKEWQ